MGEVPRSTRESCWLHCSGELALPPPRAVPDAQPPLQYFSLGKAAHRGSRNPSQAALPAPVTRLDESLRGTKRAFSPEPGVGRRGSLAGCPRARGLALWTCWLCSLSSHLMAARPVCFVGERSPHWTLPLQQGDGCIREVFPGLHLASPVVAGFGSHRGLCVNVLASLPILQGHVGHACSEIYLCL